MLPLALLLQAAPAPAPAHRTSFEAAFRSGLSIPAGELEAGVPMREVAGLQVPLFLELGARVSRRVFLGAYGAVGIGSTSSTYDQLYCLSSECGARTAHVGGEVHVHILPYKVADPWIGAGFGYEWFFTTGSPKTSMNGFEALRPMLGIDFRLGPKAALGLFVDAPLSLYTHWDPPETNAGRVPGSTTARVHTWVTFGLRLVLSRAPGS